MRPPSPTLDSNRSEQLQECEEVIGVLLGGVTVLREDAQRLSNESQQSQLRVKKLSEDVLQVKSSVKETKDFIAGIVPNHEMLQQECMSLNEIVDDRQHCSYDGCFIWKINGVREKISKSTLRHCPKCTTIPFF